MTISPDRDEFGARQAEMTARWYENVKRTYGDVDAYIATRHSAYIDRWAEASRFIVNGSRVLDIGGGNLFPALIDFFKARDFRYSFLDVDPICVDGSRNLAQSMAFAGATFQHGYNDDLPFGAGSFEAVFSSHCIEHSIDLRRTFSELNRVLVPGGNLLMAVPFGWEANPEHPYFFAPEDWISIITDAGFRVRTAQVGREYPETGYDYFVAAQKISDPKTPRLDADDYQKTGYTFMPCNDPRIMYQGETLVRDDHVIVSGLDWKIDIAVPASAREVLPILNRHDWSGVVELSWAQNHVTHDLYSWFPYVQPVRIGAGPTTPAAAVSITCAGRNPSSFASQCVVFGALFR